MKRIFTLLMTAAAFLAVESTADAQLLKNLLKKTTSSEATKVESVTAATTNGKAAGAALKSLYTQYKADGKMDMSNLTNIMNLATLANNVKDLKGQTDKSAFYKDFAAGLILGSGSLITQTNSTAVMNGLTDLVSNVDLSGLTTAATSATDKAASALTAATGKAGTAVANATEIASSVSNILNLFK